MNVEHKQTKALSADSSHEFLVGFLLAAGEGSRLNAVGVPKFLLPVGGIPLFTRALMNLYQLGAKKVIVGLPSRLRPLLANAPAEIFGPFSADKVHLHYIDTPSSIHTLAKVYDFFLKTENPSSSSTRFVVSLIDSIIAPDDLSSLKYKMDEFPNKNILLISRFADDEKPLWVGSDQESTSSDWFQVKQVGSEVSNLQGATAGVYVFQKELLGKLPDFLGRGKERLRNFLSENQGAFFGWKVDKVVDVDRPEDVCIAESFVKQAGNNHELKQ